MLYSKGFTWIILAVVFGALISAFAGDYLLLNAAGVAGFLWACGSYAKYYEKEKEKVKETRPLHWDDF